MRTFNAAAAERAERILYKLFSACVAFSALIAITAHAQIRYAVGQNVAPVFEGWERNADGSFNFVFGYMNRNYEEEVDVPVGADNGFSVNADRGTADHGVDIDRGQPAHFYPRRQQFVFKVRVPKDWGRKDLVWTLTSHGKTEKAYASLMPVWEIDAGTYQQNRGGPGELGEPDDPPAITLNGAADRAIAVGEPLTLSTTVTDDGRPTARRSGSGSNPRVEGPLKQAVVKLDPDMRLGVIWIVYRGDASAVTFDPRKVKVANGKAETVVRCSEPGMYVLRGYADDGILWDAVDVKLTCTRR